MTILNEDSPVAEITSPNYDNEYGDNLEILWYFKSEMGYPIRLRLIDFYVRPHRYDRVTELSD